MAKGSTNGVIRGKKGNTVFYKLTNSNNKEKQGWREYTAEVANPQTDGQIDQRIKLAAVNNLYRALKPIIQRGWENKKYGDESRRAFLKRALGSTFAGPYLPKGSTLAVPIEGVPITYGSLTPVAVDCDSQFAALINVPYPDGSTYATIGGLSQLFINANLTIQGDQVTIIIAALNAVGNISYLTRSFYVDPTSTVNTVDVLGFTPTDIEYESTDVLAIDIKDIAGFNTSRFAALVSISRDGDGSNLRSYAEFDMTTDFRTYFYGSTSQIAAAKASYRKKQAASTDWPLDPDSGGEATVQSAFTRSGIEITAVSLARKQTGDLRYKVIVDENGNQYYIGSRPSASSSEISYLASTSSTAAADPSDLTTANSVNVFDTNNVAAGLRAWLISKGVSATVLPV